MTIINLTVTPEAAWLSSDTALAEIDRDNPPMPAARTASAAEALSELDARPKGSPARIVGHRRKLLVLPERRLACAGAGCRLPLLCWYGMLASEGHDFDRAAVEAPARLGEIAAAMPLGHDNLVVVLAGWSEQRGRALGMAFASGEGFRPVVLGKGHSISPLPPLDDSELRELWPRAAGGEDIERFHLALGRAQAEAWRAGRFGAGLGIGGDLWLAEVTSAGAACRRLGMI